MSDRTVSTVEEIDALPTGAVLLDRDGTAWQFNEVGKWGGVGEFDDWYDAAHVARYAPLTVLVAEQLPEAHVHDWRLAERLGPIYVRERCIGCGDTWIHDPQE